MEATGESVIANTVLRVTIEEILPSRIVVRSLEGLEGYVLRFDVAWDLSEPTPWLAVGVERHVLVVSICDDGRFVGSFRRVHAELDPWARVDDLVVGNIVECTVARFTEWGAMMRLRPRLYAGWRAPRSEIGAIGDRHRMVIERVEVAWRNVVVTTLREPDPDRTTRAGGL